MILISISLAIAPMARSRIQCEPQACIVRTCRIISPAITVDQEHHASRGLVCQESQIFSLSCSVYPVDILKGLSVALDPCSGGCSGAVLFRAWPVDLIVG